MIPRVASFYESRLHRNDGNPLYVTHVLKRDFAGRIDYHHLVPDPTLQLQQIGRFDLYLWIDWGEDALTGLLPYTPITCPRPNVYWASDTHLGWDYRLQKAREFDAVCVAQRDDAERMQVALGHSRVTWLPHAVEPQAYNPAGIYAGTPEQVADAGLVHRLPKWDVAFVGHLNDPTRIAFLDTMFREFPNAWYASLRTGRRFERAADIYTQARLVLNHAIKDDLNMRVFEVLATRSCLLTPRVPGLADLFEDGVHLLTYGSTDEAIAKARQYLADDDARERIAEAGYREVLAKHTMRHRVDALLAAGGLMV